MGVICSLSISTTVNLATQCSYDKYKDWMTGSYYVDLGKEKSPTPNGTPPKQPNKKRIAIMGDSLASDNDIWGWSGHLAYKLVQEKKPFEIVNYARGAANIVAPSYTMEPGKNCYWGGEDKKDPLA